MPVRFPLMRGSTNRRVDDRLFSTMRNRVLSCCNDEKKELARRNNSLAQLPNPLLS
jgi:hypothetical protein